MINITTYYIKLQIINPIIETKKCTKKNKSKSEAFQLGSVRPYVMDSFSLIQACQNCTSDFKLGMKITDTERQNVESVETLILRLYDIL